MFSRIFLERSMNGCTCRCTCSRAGHVCLDEDATWVQPYYYSASAKSSRLLLRVTRRRPLKPISLHYFDRFGLALSHPWNPSCPSSVVERQVSDDLLALLCEIPTPPESTYPSPKDRSVSRPSLQVSTRRIR